MGDEPPSDESAKIDTLRLEIEKTRLEVEKTRIARKFQLSHQGLKSGSVGVGLVFVTVLFLIGAAFYKAPPDQAVFSGWHLVTIIFILVAGLVAYFSLVFWREVKLAAELSDKGAKVGIETGGTANRDA